MSKSVGREHLAKGSNRAKNKRWLGFSKRKLFISHCRWPELIVPNRRHRLVKKLGLEIAKPPFDHKNIYCADYVLAALVQLKAHTRVMELKTKGEARRKPSANDYPSDFIIKFANGLNLGVEVKPWRESIRAIDEFLDSYNDKALDLLVIAIRCPTTKERILHQIRSRAVSGRRWYIPLGFMPLWQMRQKAWEGEIFLEDSIETLSSISNREVPQSIANRSSSVG